MGGYRAPMVLPHQAAYGAPAAVYRASTPARAAPQFSFSPAPPAAQVTIRAPPSSASPAPSSSAPAPAPRQLAEGAPTRASEPAPASSAPSAAALAKEVEKKVFVSETALAPPAAAAAAAVAAAQGAAASDAADVDLAPVSKKGLAHPARPGLGTVGKKVMIRTNHFLVNGADNHLFHYDVAISPESKSRQTNREVLNELIKLHGKTALGGKLPAYHGKKSLYTAGSLPFESEEFVVTLVDPEKEDKERAEREYKITIRIAGRTDLYHLQQFLRGRKGHASKDHTKETLLRGERLLPKPVPNTNGAFTEYRDAVSGDELSHLLLHEMGVSTKKLVHRRRDRVTAPPPGQGYNTYEDVLYRWTLEVRSEAPSASNRAGPWQVQGRRLPNGVDDYVVVEAMFTLKGQAFFTDLAQGLVYCDLPMADGSAVDFHFIPLPAEAPPVFRWAKVEPEDMDWYRTMSCTGGSIKFVCIDRSARLQPEDMKVIQFTLDLPSKKWTKNMELRSIELWKFLGFKKKGLPETVPKCPVLMTDNTLTLLLPNLMMKREDPSPAVPGREWAVVECASRTAYGCGEHGQRVLDGLALHVRLVTPPLRPDLSTALYIRASDDALHGVRAAFGDGDGAPIDILVDGKGYVEAADENGIVLTVVFRLRDYLGSRAYYLVYEATDASLAMIPSAPDDHPATSTLRPLPVRRDGGGCELVILAERRVPPAEEESCSTLEDVLCVWTPSEAKEEEEPWRVHGWRYP
ncbi:Protein argonaute MEL1 [Dichanthelium oligosanthes]|uniref:Protein argonaute MEL1 n=1 Tax=Dichanthelium oligosanthes TaxID=888268 RepID=A0A1E5URF9_9POAL|nr:Protein argonaute MEL1 [Dichanthelium oligosanthes]